MTGQHPSSELYSLLGLSSDTSVSKLRWVYERAMAEATRSGDKYRALALSRAYDALSPTTRRQVYAPVLERSTPPPPPIPPWRGRAAVAEGPDPSPRRRRVRPPRKSALLRGLVYLIGVPAAVIAGVAYHVHYHHDPAARLSPQQVSVPYPSYPRVTVAPAPVPPARTINPAGATAGRARFVPLDTRVDVHGLVTVVCRPRGSRPGYEQFVQPGAIVACANGAIPQIAG